MRFFPLKHNLPFLAPQTDCSCPASGSLPPEQCSTQQCSGGNCVVVSANEFTDSQGTRRFPGSCTWGTRGNCKSHLDPYVWTFDGGRAVDDRLKGSVLILNFLTESSSFLIHNSSNIVGLNLGTRFYDRKTSGIDQNFFTGLRCEFSHPKNHSVKLKCFSETSKKIRFLQEYTDIFYKFIRQARKSKDIRFPWNNLL